MMRLTVVTLAANMWLASAALAQPPIPQQAPDPAVLQQAINALHDQRNEALDKALMAETNRRLLAVEVEKLKASVAQLSKDNADLKAKAAPAPVAPQKDSP